MIITIASFSLIMMTSSIDISHATTPLATIKNHPIDTIVAQYVKKNAKTTIPQKISNMRIMHIDLDYVFDTDKRQQQRNIQTLVNRIKNVQPNTIYLQAFSDPDANGSADQVYFQNRHMPVRDNLFSVVLQAIRQQTNVQHVYAWLPLISWELPQNYPVPYVKNSLGIRLGYIRISPFDSKNQNIVAEIFYDFIRYNAVDGVLYHDDITLSDYEDSSASAQKVYPTWGFNDLSILKNPRHPKQALFARHKTAYLDQFAAGITKILKTERPQLLTARNMYAPVVLNPDSEEWFSQSQGSTMRYYDYNAIMAMPYMEGSTNHKQFYLDLIKNAKRYDSNLSRTVFELQTVNWTNNTKISSQEIAETIQFLKQNGVKHIGYYPDDFYQNHPDIKSLNAVFSTNR